jgi:hypothetical protein
MSDMTPLIQLTRAGVAVACDADLQVAARRFQRDRRLHLPAFLSPELRHLVQPRLAAAPFKQRIARHVHPPAVDLKLDDETLHGSLRWLMSAPALFAAIGTVAAIAAINSFNGAVYRMVADQGHHDSWHDDVDGRRRVAITVNLSDGPFDGGELQMRRAASKERLWTFANVGAGDALLFAIDPSLEHCIAPVRGPRSKTALAGWFCT